MQNIIYKVKKIVASFLILPMGLFVFPVTLGAQSADNNTTPPQSQSTESTQKFDEVLAQQDDLTIFRAISKAGRLDETLSSGGPYTLFIPSDEAIKDLPKDVLMRFSDNKGYIEDTLKNHIVASPVTTEDINNGFIKNELGNDLTIESSGEASRVSGQRILRSMPYENGVIYVIDGLMLP